MAVFSGVGKVREIKKVASQNGDFISLTIMERKSRTVKEGEAANDFWPISIFGQRSVENFSNLVAEGDTISVAGDLTMREYTVDGGQKRKTPQVTAYNWRLVHKAEAVAPHPADEEMVPPPDASFQD